MDKILVFFFILALFSPPVLAGEESLAPRIVPPPRATYDYLVVLTWERPADSSLLALQYKAEASLDPDFEQIASSSAWLGKDVWSFVFYPLPRGEIYLRVGARILGEEKIFWSETVVTEQKGPDAFMPSLSQSSPPHPVIFIHGLNGQPSDWENREENRDYVTPLIERGFKKELIYLYPYADYNQDGVYDFQGEIEGIARDLPSVVRELSIKHKSMGGDGRVDIVAFSLGGLVSRAYFAGEEFDHKIRRFIDIATPHQGVYLGEIVNFLDLLPFKGPRIKEAFLRFATQIWSKIGGGRRVDFQSPAVRAVMPNSKFLQDLNQSHKTPQSLEYWCLYGDIHVTLKQKIFFWDLESRKFSLGDLLILPQSATGIPGNLCQGVGFVDEEEFRVKMIRGKVSPLLEIVAPLESLKFWHGSIIKQEKVKEKVFQLLQ